MEAFSDLNGVLIDLLSHNRRMDPFSKLPKPDFIGLPSMTAEAFQWLVIILFFIGLCIYVLDTLLHEPEDRL